MSLFRVYRLIFPHGKGYVGQTSQMPVERFRQHVRPGSGCVLVRRAVQKYGKESVRLETLAVTNHRDVDTSERVFIAAYQTFAPFGYNLTPGGKGRRLLAVEDLEYMDLMRGAYWTAKHPATTPDDEWKILWMRRGLADDDVRVIRNLSRIPLPRSAPPLGDAYVPVF